MAIGRAKTRQRVQTATHRGGRGAHTELGGDLTVLAGRHHVHLGETGVDEGRNEKDGDGDADSGDGGVDDGLSAGNDGHTEVVAIGIHDVDTLSHLAESHEEDVGDTSGGDGDEGKAHLKDGVGTLHAVDELVASEGDGDGDGDGGAVGLADVGHGLGDGGVTVGVVEDGVVRLVDPLPEDDVEGGGGGEEHTGLDGDVTGDEGAHATDDVEGLAGLGVDVGVEDYGVRRGGTAYAPWPPRAPCRSRWRFRS